MGIDELLPGVLPKLPKPRIPYRKKRHEYNNYPHFETAFPHRCLCMDTCCLTEKGCTCKGCTCGTYPHGSRVDPQVHNPASSHDLDVRRQEQGSAPRPLRKVP